MASTFIPIQTITTSTSPTSITFNSIPQTYKHLCLIGNLNNTASANLKIAINSDTGTSYLYGEILMAGTATMKQYKSLASIYGFGNSEVWTSAMSALEVWIPNYVTTSLQKPFLYRTSAMDYSSLGSQTSTWGGGQWTSTNAITSISIYTTSGTLSNGSNVTIYGLA